MSRVYAVYSFALIASCLSMLAAATLAQNAPGIPGIPGVPSIGVPGIPGTGIPGVPDGSACWSNLQSIRGCVEAILDSARTGRMIKISPACCKAFMAVSDACWPKMFPYNPYFPPMLKNQCMKMLPPPPAY